MENQHAIVRFPWEMPEYVRPRLQALLLKAAKCHNPALEDVPLAMYLRIFDEVFSKNWNTTHQPRLPTLGDMNLAAGAIIVGKFREDLPPSSDKQASWDKEHNPDALNKFLDQTRRTKAPQTNSARLKGKPAFFRARMDKTGQSVVHDFIDANGKWVPASYITFDNGGTKVTRREMSTAYQTADVAREELAKAFSIALCVYLWQKILYNAVRVDNHWNPQERGLVNWTEHDFIVPVLIGDSIEAFREDIDYVAADFREFRARHVRSLT
ncbi:hypothetical protein KJ359_003351 [Pestalotiopsis sp. 9143b]|nr:hypothetical protein KJ359_003351 [Pestalotiopsis sp. 9143b]